MSNCNFHGDDATLISKGLQFLCLGVSKKLNMYHSSEQDMSGCICWNKAMFSDMSLHLIGK